MSRERSMKLKFSAPVLLALGLVSACSSESENDPVEMDCLHPGDDGVMVTPVASIYDIACPLDGFPFVESATAVSIRASTVTANQPRAGTLCLSGKASMTDDLSAGALTLDFTRMSADRTQVLSALNADSLGITQLAFSVDSPPSPGLLVEATSVKSVSCPEDPRACTTPVPGFALLTGPGSSERLRITTAGRVVAPLANFERSNTMSGTFDTSAIDHVAFRSLGEYDFCLSDVEFLDADGNPVRP